MEPHHKEMLIQHRVELVDEINMRDGLLTQLISRKVLSPRMARTLQTGKTTDQQTEALLDLLPTRGPDTFTFFCDSLKADYQDHVVKLFLEPQTASTGNRDNIYDVEPGANCSGIQDTMSHVVDQNTVTSDTSNVVKSCFKHPTGSSGVQEHLRYAEPQIHHSGIQDNLINVGKRDNISYVEPRTNSSGIQDNLKNVGRRDNISYIPRPVGTDISGIQDNLTDVFKRDNISYVEPCTNTSGMRNNLTEKRRDNADPGIQDNLADARKRNNIHVHNQNVSTVGYVQSKYQTDNIMSPNRSSDNQTQNAISNNIHSENQIQSSNDIRSTNIERRTPPSQSRSNDIRSTNIERRTPPSQSRSNDIRSTNIERRTPPSQSRSNDIRSINIERRTPASQSEDSDVMTCLGGATETRIVLKHHIQHLRDSHWMDAGNKKICVYDNYEQCQNNDKDLDKGDNSDDEGIDLTDGEVLVKVDPCTMEFYLAHRDSSYRMSSSPRGLALVINVNNVVGKGERRGTSIDRDNMTDLLRQLDFDVTVYDDRDDLTAKGMLLKLLTFASLPKHSQSDACILVILSHGEQDLIYGTDGQTISVTAILSVFDNVHCPTLIGKPKIVFLQACRGVGDFIYGTDGQTISVTGILSVFDNVHCPTLIGKPKIVFLQACRGGALDSGCGITNFDEPDSGDVQSRLPSLSDFVVCYPTQQGYYAWRNRERGSWYVEAVVQIFMKYAATEDLCSMLNRVNAVVSRKVSRSPDLRLHNMTQMSEFRSSLRRPHLYLFPGVKGHGGVRGHSEGGRI